MTIAHPASFFATGMICTVYAVLLYSLSLCKLYKHFDGSLKVLHKLNFFEQIFLTFSAEVCNM